MKSVKRELLPKLNIKLITIALLLYIIGGNTAAIAQTDNNNDNDSDKEILDLSDKYDLDQAFSFGGDSLTEDKVNLLDGVEMPPLEKFLSSVEKHPSVRIYDERRAEAEARLKVTRQKWMNYLRVSGNYSYGKSYSLNGSEANEFGYSYTNGRSVSSSYGVGVSLSIPIADIFGSQKNSVRAEKAKMRQMEYDMAVTIEERKLVVLSAYNNVLQELAVFRAKAEAAALYNAQMKISENDFIKGKIDVISLSLERSRRSGALVSFESAKVSLQNAITQLEMLTNIKIMKR